LETVNHLHCTGTDNQTQEKTNDVKTKTNRPTNYHFVQHKQLCYYRWLLDSRQRNQHSHSTANITRICT